jgi:flagellar biosynthesis protein FliR
MPTEKLLQSVPVFVLVFFRLAGLMMFAPLFGSARIPRRVKVMLALVLSVGMIGAVKTPVVLPESTWQLAAGIAGEMLFGIAMGMVMGFVFVAAQWSGQMIGQQMGLNMSEVLDPQFGGAGSIIGDLNFMLTTVVFLTMQGHCAMLLAIRASFQSLPLLSVGMDGDLLDMVLRLFQTSTMLAVQLAAPMLITMIVVDLVLGFLGKTIPQLNIMTAGLSLRAMVGMAVLLLGVVLSSEVLGNAVSDSMQFVEKSWMNTAAHSFGGDGANAPQQEVQ